MLKRSSDVKARAYTQEQVEMGRRMYMDYKTNQEISIATGMSIYAVKFWAKKYWKIERDLHKSQIIELLGDAKGRAFAEISMYGMELLVRSLKEHAQNGTILSLKESFALSHILTNIDKMIRLDDGTPTDIIKDIKPADRGEIIQLVQADPFYKKLPSP